MGTYDRRTKLMVVMVGSSLSVVEEGVLKSLFLSID